YEGAAADVAFRPAPALPAIAASCVALAGSAAGRGALLSASALYPGRSAAWVGRLVLSASDDGTARVWEAQTGKLRFVLKHQDYITRASFSSDGRRIVTASQDRTAKVWDARTGTDIATLK